MRLKYTSRPAPNLFLDFFSLRTLWRADRFFRGSRWCDHWLYNEVIRRSIRWICVRSVRRLQQQEIGYLNTPYGWDIFDSPTLFSTLLMCIYVHASSDYVRGGMRGSEKRGEGVQKRRGAAYLPSVQRASLHQSVFRFARCRTGFHK